MSSPVRVLEDGTRVYTSGMTYKPVPAAERRNKVRRPEDPRAVRWYNEWIILVELLPDDRRVLPETVPDSEAYEHWLVRNCRCHICTRVPSKVWKERGHRKRGTESESLLDGE